MHIGGMRTAIYNWLYARQNGGQFLLRIDDTDKARHVEGAIPSIKDSLRWMRLDWDQEFYQSERRDRHIAEAKRLVAEGKAYEEEGAIKLRLDPEWSSVVVQDRIRGRVEFPCDQYGDIMLCRADGSPLYNLATVVDDHEMEITHVIRAEEHLSNVAPQVIIGTALGYNIPEYAHVPFVKEPGSNLKFSKRAEYKSNPRFKKLMDIATKLGVDGSPAHVDFYEKIGIFSISLFNSLVRTGWSYDGVTEYLSPEDAIEKFALDKVSKSPAEFDPDKLLACQAHWMNTLTMTVKVAECLRFAPGTGEPTWSVVELLGQRLKLASDIVDYPEFFCDDDKVTFDEAIFDFRLRKDKEAAKFLLALEEKLKAAPHESVRETLEKCLEENGTNIGRMVHALRIATTGKASGPNIVDIMMMLGQASCLKRISCALER